VRYLYTKTVCNQAHAANHISVDSLRWRPPHDPLLEARNRAFRAFSGARFGIDAAVLSLAWVHHQTHASSPQMSKLPVPIHFERQTRWRRT
jgi:hypothetical protein